MSCLGLEALARLKEKCGKSQQARQAYRRGIVVNPEHGPAYVVSHDKQHMHLFSPSCRIYHNCVFYMLEIGMSALHVSSCPV